MNPTQQTPNPATSLPQDLPNTTDKTTTNEPLMTAEDIETTGPTDEPGKQSSTNPPAPANGKVFVLAVVMVDGKAGITPFDVEFEADDQTPLSKTEQSLFKKTQAKFEQNRHGFEQALQALHIIFAGRLYREKFASLDQYLLRAPRHGAAGG